MSDLKFCPHWFPPRTACLHCTNEAASEREARQAAEAQAARLTRAAEDLGRARDEEHAALVSVMERLDAAERRAEEAERERDEATLARDVADQNRKNAACAVVIAQERIEELWRSLNEAREQRGLLAAEVAKLRREANEDRNKLADSRDAARAEAEALRKALEALVKRFEKAQRHATAEIIRRALASAGQTTKEE